MHRRGTVFLFALAVMGVLFALAFGMLSSSTLASNSAFEGEPSALADQAAKEGVAHAISVIHEDFTRSYNGGANAVPTHFGDDWNVRFWPIDTYDNGRENGTGYDSLDDWIDSDPTQTYPRGKEMYAFDANENDVHVENFLHEMYLGIKGQARGYERRGEMYQQGWTPLPGSGRWYEPGVFLTDTSTGDSLPVSFHLSYQRKADGTAVWNGHASGDAGPDTGSKDPAVYKGEPDDPASPGANQVGVFNPMRYDANLRPTEDPKEVRYRLRYAVAIEPIDGKLPYNMQDDYSSAGADASNTGTPPSDGSEVGLFSEYDEQREVYAAALGETLRWLTDAHDDYFDIMAAGRGHHYGLDLNDPHALKSISGGVLNVYDDSDTDRDDPGYLLAIDDEKVYSGSAASGTVHYENIGPLASYQSFMSIEWAQDRILNDNAPRRMYAITPFAWSPNVVGALNVASGWNDAYTDQPVRMNVSTANPRSVYAMILAYCPQEVKVVRYTFEYDSGNNTIGSAVSSSNDRGVEDTIDLFTYFGTERSSFSNFTSPGGIAGTQDKYPGVEVDASGQVWTKGEGGEIIVAENEQNSAADVFGLDNTRSEIAIELFKPKKYADEKYRLIEDGYTSGGTEVNAEQDDGGTEFDKEFYYADSYWLDVLVALHQATAMAHFTWGYAGKGRRGFYDPEEPDNGHWPVWRDIRWKGASTNGTYDARSGHPFYFNPNDVYDVAIDPTWGQARDYDIDGDGSVTRHEIPSSFDTVRELDRQFLRNLREIPYHYPAGQRPSLANLITTADTYHGQTVPEDFYTSHGLFLSGSRGYTADANDGSKNIKERLRDGSITADQAKLMELIVNDARMSFFGASPQYVDADGNYDFRPMDLDDDGDVYFSGYSGGWAPAVGLPSTSPNDITGDGVNESGLAGPLPTIGQIFSLTGYFVFQKSRYYRIFVRGELFDELRQVPVAQTNLETVYVVDPDGDVWNMNNEAGGGSLNDSHVIFQRRLYNAYRGTRSHAAQ